jgi:hypothetical protein
MKIKQVLIALDQLLNTILGGWADETLSSRSHRCWPRIEKAINLLFWWDPNHCYNSYLSEIQRRQFPPEMRNKEKE